MFLNICVISLIQSQGNAFFLDMVFLARWDFVYGIQRPELVRNHDVVFNKEKMHKKPMPTVEV